MKKEKSNWSTKQISTTVNAVLITILLTFSFTLMVMANTPTGFPTVIEPGSQIVPADFIVFKDGSTIDARNGTTGAVDFSGPSFYTIITDCIAALPTSGLISIRTGQYTLSADLKIDTPGVSIEGMASAGVAQSDTLPWSTVLLGNVYIQAENVKLSHLDVYGDVEIGTSADGGDRAHWVTLSEVNIYGQYRFNGTINTDVGAPFSIIFKDGSICPSAVDQAAILFKNSGGTINHIYFVNTVITMFRVGGEAIRVEADHSVGGGAIGDVHFSNVVFLMDELDQCIINLTGLGNIDGWTMEACNFEINHAQVTFIYIASTMIGAPLDLTISGSRFQTNSNLAVLVNDTTAYSATSRNARSIRFLACTFYAPTTLNFYANTSNPVPQVRIYFIDCELTLVSIVSLGGVDNLATAYFIDCPGFNPTGHRTNWVYDHNGLYAFSLTGNVNYLMASHNYVVYDVGIWLTATVGTGVNINITDCSGNAIISNAVTLARTYIPVGYTVNFGPFSVAPTFTIDGE